MRTGLAGDRKYILRLVCRGTRRYLGTRVWWFRHNGTPHTHTEVYEGVDAERGPMPCRAGNTWISSNSSSSGSYASCDTRFTFDYARFRVFSSPTGIVGVHIYVMVYKRVVPDSFLVGREILSSLGLEKNPTILLRRVPA